MRGSLVARGTLVRSVVQLAVLLFSTNVLGQSPRGLLRKTAQN